MRREGFVLFGDLLDRAGELVGRRAAIRDSVRRGIRQLLVDEFQDTDRRQCELLAPARARRRAERRGPASSWSATRSSRSTPGAAPTSPPTSDSSPARSPRAAMRARLAVNFRSAPPILWPRSSAASRRRWSRRPALQPAFEPLVASRGRRRARSRFAAERRRSSSGSPGRRAGASTRAADANGIEARAARAPTCRRQRELEPASAWSEFAILARTAASSSLPRSAARGRRAVRGGERPLLLPPAGGHRPAAAVRAVLDRETTWRCVAGAALAVRRRAGRRAGCRSGSRLSRPCVDGLDGARSRAARRGVAPAVAETAPRIAADDPRARRARRLAGGARRRGRSRSPSCAARWREEPAERLARAAPLPVRGGADRRGAVPRPLRRSPTSSASSPSSSARSPRRRRSGRRRSRALRRAVERATRRRGGAPAARARRRGRACSRSTPPRGSSSATSTSPRHRARAARPAQAVRARPPRRRGGERGVARAPRRALSRLARGAPSIAEARSPTRESVRLLYVAHDARARSRSCICRLWSSSRTRAPDALVPCSPRAGRSPAASSRPLRARRASADRGPALWRRLRSSPRSPRRAARRPRPTSPVEGADVRRRARARSPRERAAATALGARFRVRRASRPRTGRASRVEAGADRTSLARRPTSARAAAASRSTARSSSRRSPRPSRRRWRAPPYLDAAAGRRLRGRARALDADLDALLGSALWRRLAVLEPGGPGARAPARSSPTRRRRRTDAAEQPARRLPRHARPALPRPRERRAGGRRLQDADAGRGRRRSRGDRAARYAPQLRLYGRAVRDALGLAAPPRLELWLLGADRVERPVRALTASRRPIAAERCPSPIRPTSSSTSCSTAQRPLSDGPEHDEMLFIVIHQVYELWFKQMLHEIDYLLTRLDADDLPAVLRHVQADPHHPQDPGGADRHPRDDDAGLVPLVPQPARSGQRLPVAAVPRARVRARPAATARHDRAPRRTRRPLREARARGSPSRASGTSSSASSPATASRCRARSSSATARRSNPESPELQPS